MKNLPMKLFFLHFSHNLWYFPNIRQVIEREFPLIIKFIIWISSFPWSTTIFVHLVSSLTVSVTKHYYTLQHQNGHGYTTFTSFKKILHGRPEAFVLMILWLPLVPFQALLRFLNSIAILAALKFHPTHLSFLTTYKQPFIFGIARFVFLLHYESRLKFLLHQTSLLPNSRTADLKTKKGSFKTSIQQQNSYSERKARYSPKRIWYQNEHSQSSHLLQSCPRLMANFKSLIFLLRRGHFNMAEQSNGDYFIPKKCLALQTWSRATSHLYSNRNSVNYNNYHGMLFDSVLIVPVFYCPIELNWMI